MSIFRINNPAIPSTDATAMKPVGTNAAEAKPEALKSGQSNELKSGEPEPTHYHYIDALRGLAILVVILFHCSLHIPDLPHHLLHLCDFGKYGVQLFFVLSALTLLLSFHSRRREKQALRNFYLRRLLRIAPLFWFGIILYNYTGLHPNVFAPAGITWWQILATVMFLHGWYPTFINSVVPGGWSIAAEMMFYGIFPVLAVWLSNQKRILLALFVSLMFSVALNHSLSDYMDPSWQGHRAMPLGAFLDWWFPSQLPVFLIGFLLYHKIKALAGATRTLKQRQTASACVGGACLITAFLILATHLQDLILIHTRTTSLMFAAFAVAFALLVYGLALVPLPLFVNRFMRYLGVISFSGYIDHFFVLAQMDAFLLYLQRHFALSPVTSFIVFGLVALMATITVATVTYHGIEKPGIALGRKWIFYLDAKVRTLV